uniref:Exonuclease domain-containing protein n=1 Tax=Biomphalaria glabrata TaxID=6526 RepID=A0A2C9JJU4_BIOGL
MAHVARICLSLRSKVCLAAAYNFKTIFNKSSKTNSCLYRIASVKGMSSNANMPCQDKGIESLSKNTPIIWIDLEMTGLDVDKDRIIEIACLVTDGDLQLIAQGEDLVIHQSDEILNNMGEWCTNQHGQSGLTEAVRKSQISTAEAERRILDFLRKHTEERTCPLAGNSVYMDKLFLEKYMPSLTQHLHYRIIDVSTVKEICRRWYPQNYESAPIKKSSHRAMDDILESVEELKYYRSTIFKS